MNRFKRTGLFLTLALTILGLSACTIALPVEVVDEAASEESAVENVTDEPAAYDGPVTGRRLLGLVLVHSTLKKPH